VHFEIVSETADVEVIAAGVRIRERRRLWRTLWPELVAKGIARVRLATGAYVTAELHWYEAHGIGKKEFKIKRVLPAEH